MLIANFFSWWYTSGFTARTTKLTDSLRRNLDYFSFGLLLRTLFSPFRQIDAGVPAEGSLETRARKFGDRLISRFVGAFMRLMILIIGALVMFLQLIYCALAITFHIILPFLPLAGLIMLTIGWIPSWPL